MSPTLFTLKGLFSQCIRPSCEDSNCKLQLSSFPKQQIILDLDCIAQQRRSPIQGKRCDRLIVIEAGDKIFLLPVEFKTTWVIPEKIKEQLEGGIGFFKKYHENQFHCYPVLVSRNLRTSIRKQLQKISISWNGRKTRIKHVLCNDSLSWKAVHS